MLVDLIIHDAAQLVTCASPDGPKRGAAMADVGLIKGGAVAVVDGMIVDIGPTHRLRTEHAARRLLDASGKVVCPGFIDSHTHIVYGGDRLDEFEMRINGASYMEIMQAGGGIVNTVSATRSALRDTLTSTACARLDKMLALGTTSVEIKTGYGLDTPTELKMLDVIAALDATRIIDVVPTFLGAHAVPPEYRGRTDDYITLVVDEMLPAAHAWYKESAFAAKGVPFFVDVFCEDGVFDAAQSSLVLRAAQQLGLPCKAHVDEFTSIGGVTVGLKADAVSVDHLDVTTSADIRQLAESETVGVVLPAVNFHLGNPHYAPIRAMIDAGVIVALATDMNPGSAPCYSLPMVMAIACRHQQMLPAEALNAVTINAAHAVGLGDRVGSIEVGKQADVLLIDTPDYRMIAYELGHNPIERVVKRGQIVR